MSPLDRFRVLSDEVSALSDGFTPAAAALSENAVVPCLPAAERLRLHSRQLSALTEIETAVSVHVYRGISDQGRLAMVLPLALLPRHPAFLSYRGRVLSLMLIVARNNLGR
jgi:hypothetical protein